MLDRETERPDDGLTEADLERVRAQLRAALERLRSTVERTQRAFQQMRMGPEPRTSSAERGDVEWAALRRRERPR